MSKNVEIMLKIAKFSFFIKNVSHNKWMKFDDVFILFLISANNFFC